MLSVTGGLSGASRAPGAAPVLGAAAELGPAACAAGDPAAGGALAWAAVGAGALAAAGWPLGAAAGAQAAASRLPAASMHHAAERERRQGSRVCPVIVRYLFCLRVLRARLAQTADRVVHVGLIDDRIQGWRALDQPLVDEVLQVLLNAGAVEVAIRIGPG